MNLDGHGFDMARFITGEEPQVTSAVVSRQGMAGTSKITRL
jgi:predicted dehydrogenase